MMQEERSALLNEFWNSYAGKQTNVIPLHDFFQSGTSGNMVREVVLDLGQEEAITVRKLCSDNDVLVFNFYATVFSVLLCRYFSYQNATFLCPEVQLNKGAQSWFLFNSPVDRKESFKDLFARNKRFVVMSLPYAADYTTIAESISGESLAAFSAVSLSLNDPGFGNRSDNISAALHVSENGPVPALTISCRNSGSEKLMELFLHNFRELLNGIIARIYDPIETLEIFSEKEKAILSRFNATAEHYPLDSTVVALWEEQVRNTPGSIAVKCEDVILDYSELNKRANRLAVYLVQTHHVAKGDMVVVKMERSEWLLVSMLAIYKAGAVYVPVDPEYPESRIEYILADCNCKVMIDEAELGKFHLQAEMLPDSNPLLAAIPADLAYVIYTSGSTGKPKGVMVEHLGMLNHLFAKRTFLQMNASTCIIQNASQSFDISVWQFLAALLCGGSVIIYQQELVTDPAEMLVRLEDDKPSVLELVPSYLSVMLDLCEAGQLGYLQYLMVTGEELKPSLVRRWFDHFPGIKLVNAYGPTEASDDITHYLMHGYSGEQLIPVGRTVANLQIYITDEQMHLCPMGVKGEICVSGPGVGRGYLNNELKTSEQFREDPFNEKKGIRMYKTGDVGRYREDGNIEFFGRKDDQVKIRGNRIELGEIERAILDCTDVEAVAVIVLPGNDMEKELAAYLVTSNDGDTGDIRNALAGQLPAYMIPAFFIRLKALPLTHNGKVDRNKLLAISALQSQQRAEIVLPRNITEQRLLQIWKTLLGREHISVKDNFFELGGHSLKATRLASMIHREFEVKVTLKQLFARPVLEQQSFLINESAKETFVAIPVLPAAADYSLSSQQRRLWVLSQFGEASAAYNIPRAWHFDGPLDTAALKAAFNVLLERHEILRTVFLEEDGFLKQVVDLKEAGNFEIAMFDLQLHKGTPVQEEELNRQLYEYYTMPFDLAEGPLLRVCLFQLEEKKWVLATVMHHIISDGWSMDILIREWMTAYHSLVTHTELTLPPLRIQYRDYAAWQYDQLSGEQLKVHADHWRTQFEGELPVLQLPFAKARPAIKTYNGGVIYHNIDATLLNKVNAFVHHNGASLFMGLLAALNALLYKYSGQDDLVIGTPVAGREHTDLEGQIGYYINTLALRTRFNGGNNYHELLENVKQVTLGAYEHQVYPFEDLVDELHVQRDMSRSALFDVMLILQNTDPSATAIEPEHFTIHAYDAGVHVNSKFDLTFNFVETAGVLQLGIEYNSDVFSREVVDRMAIHLEQTIEWLIAYPDVATKHIDYLSAAEKHVLLNDFNNIASPVTGKDTIISLFEAQVLAAPLKVALQSGGKELTYEELNMNANKLADYLKKNYSIGPDDLAAIKLPRNEWMLAAMLAVLKSGAAYVPIDPAYPAERIDHMLKDSGCKVVIDEDELMTFSFTWDDHSGDNPVPQNTETDLAYVIYTSGSTGKPKGVMIEHHSVVSFLANFNDRFSLRKGLVMGAVTNNTFDISVLELLGTLLSGIELFLFPDADPISILSSISAGTVDALQLTPSRLAQLLEADRNALQVLCQLKVLLVGGEALSQQHFALLKKLPQTRVVNVYGPTETTIWSSALDVSGAESLSVGKPLQGEQLFILDEGSQLCPVGVTGEICIGGNGLARGYLNNPLLTNEKFVPHPFLAEQRIYRTGDLGSWQPDGNIRFAGRKDDQLKIQGYRIEPGEIEAALLEHEEIDAAVVMPNVLADGTSQLVAYIKSTRDVQLHATDIRTYLEGILPVYMLPAHFIQLPEFPLNNSGKIDRKKLPDPAGLEMQVEEAYVPPGNMLEEKLAVIWQSILGREKIGVKDNFFNAGGNSLNAIRVLSRIRNEFEIDIRIEDVFNHLTIASLAEEVARRVWLKGNMDADRDNNTIVTI